MDDLTPRQAEALDYILDCYADGYLPSMREIGGALGINSPNGVAGHLRELRTKGYLADANNRPIQLTAKGRQCVR